MAASRSPRPGAGPRARAIRVLDTWERERGERFAEDLIRECAASGAGTLSEPDRALLHAIVMAVLRNRSLLDFWIDALASRPAGRLRPGVRTILRAGLAELLVLQVSPHAAVNENVSLAPTHARGLVNAILRRADRERARLLQDATAAPPAVRFSHPPDLVARWEARFGTAATLRLLEWDNAPAPITVRLNPLRSTQDQDPAITIAEPGTPVPLPDAVSDLASGFDPAPRFLDCPRLPSAALASGTVYAQDISTALAPLLLRPAAGSRILDACAAPGGKTALLAALAHNSAEIVAVDRTPERLARLEDNLARLGVRNTSVVAHDWETGPLPQAPGRPGTFDFILVDVPCSNSGVLRRRVDARWRFTNTSLQELTRRQRRILDAVTPSLAPGGRLVYSTCSIDPDENDALVHQPGPLATQRLTLLESRSLLPWRDHCDGAFAALFIPKHTHPHLPPP